MRILFRYSLEGGKGQECKALYSVYDSHRIYVIPVGNAKFPGSQHLIDQAAHTKAKR